MVAPRVDVALDGEELLARLTTAAYSVALRHGLKAPFIDVELALWRELRRVLADEFSAAALAPRLWVDAAEAVA
ncbi:MAG TPA: hypothetical protein VKA46_41155 [Gemmataceae bacterium]|nr:hypothetical protein [Gemmataceae bacterium]